MVAAQADAAIWINGQDPTHIKTGPSDPEYSDLFSGGLNVSYKYSGGSGTLMITNALNAVKGGNYTTARATTFPTGNYSGYFSLTATLAQVNGVWSITGGTFEVDGNLIAGGTNYKDVLLKGNLATGAAGAAFGYENSAGLNYAAYNNFEFGYALTGGKLAGDFKINGLGTGDIVFNAGFQNNGSGFLGDWSKAFNNGIAGNGVADTFVPEPAAYSVVGAVVALASLALSRGRFAKVAVA